MPTSPFILRKIDFCRAHNEDFLNLSSLELTVIPPEVFGLTQLKTLSLNYNHITEIPEAITQLTQLEYLGLEGNHIVSISPTVALWLGKVKMVALQFNEKSVENVEKQAKTPYAQALEAVKNAELEETLAILNRQFPENTDLSLIEFRLKDIERSYAIQKVLERDDYERGRNQIVIALLEFLKENKF
jgi:Leucine-rich repeat (LRR) protein